MVDLLALPAEAAVEQLLGIGSTIGRRAILIPTSDDLTILVGEHADQLSRSFIMPAQPPHLPRALADKREMHILARKHAIPTPDVRFPASVDEVEQYAADAPFPVVLKGIDGQRLKARTGLKMAIVERPEELVPLYIRLEDPDEPNLMLQEYIPGGDDSVWMFNGYFGREGDCLVGFTGRKLRQTPAYTGVTSLGVCLPNPVVRDQTTKWMQELGYRGILDIGYRYDARDRHYKALDANPRIGATFRLFVGTNGIDVVRALYLDLTGQPVEVAEPREGRKWIVEGGDFDSFRTHRRDGKLSLRSWLGSLAGIEESAHFAKDDLAPVVAVIASRVIRSAPGTATATAVPESTEGRGAGDRTATAPRRPADPEILEGPLSGWQETALAWLQAIGLPNEPAVLQLGSGGDLLATRLGNRGFRVITAELLGTTAEHAGDPGDTASLAEPLGGTCPDTDRLAFPDDSFDVVLWLNTADWSDRAATETARVLRPAGVLLIVTDNLLGLQNWMDPIRNPAVQVLRRGAGRILARLHEARQSGGPVPRRQGARTVVNRLIAEHGFTKVRSTTIGLAPLTFANRRLVSNPDRVRIQRRLGQLAASDIPLITRFGSHHLFLLRGNGDRPGSAPAASVVQAGEATASMVDRTREGAR